MSSWMRKNLGDPMLVDETLESIKAVLQTTREKSSCRDDMEIFIRHESEGRLHCEVIVYFSPSMTEVANAFNAEPCKKPSQSGLDLLDIGGQSKICLSKER